MESFSFKRVKLSSTVLRIGLAEIQNLNIRVEQMGHLALKEDGLSRRLGSN